MMTPARAAMQPARRMTSQKLRWMPGSPSGAEEPKWKVTLSAKRSEANHPTV
jgi:hypothetical protein